MDEEKEIEKGKVHVDVKKLSNIAQDSSFGDYLTQEMSAISSSHSIILAVHLKGVGIDASRASAIRPETTLVTMPMISQETRPQTGPWSEIS